MLVFTTLNPVDLGRIMILLQMDMSALMGYTGAIFREFFDTGTGTTLATIILFIWILFPLWLSVRSFAKKDL